MDEEIKKKLQEMARAHVLNTYNIDMDRSVIDEVMWKDEAQDFLDGAQAAWDLAVKHERERIYKDVEAGLAKLAVTLRNSKSRSELQAICEHDACLIASGYLKSIILNPPAPPQQGE